MSRWLTNSSQAKAIIAAEPKQNHEYLPIHGSDDFLQGAKALCFGPLAGSPSICSVQTISGTGANHLAALFCAHHLQPAKVFIANPTWVNHGLIWQVAAPNVQRCAYQYYNPELRELAFDAMIQTLSQEAKWNDVVVLQACAHNPTGIDPTQTQWKMIADVVKRKRLFVVLDSAYQGFATGDVDKDAWAIRYFTEKLFVASTQPGDDAGPAGMMVCQSFAKNFGLYGERIGALHLVLPNSVQTSGAFRKLQRLIRAEISNAPRFGAKIVETVLKDAELRAMWHKDLDTMSSRIKTMRSLLRQKLENLGSQRNWSHLTTQIGMFAYTGLSEAEVQHLRDEHHVFLMKSGRASISGLNMDNIDLVASAMHVVTK